MLKKTMRSIVCGQLIIEESLLLLSFFEQNQIVLFKEKKLMCSESLEGFRSHFIMVCYCLFQLHNRIEQFCFANNFKKKHKNDMGKNPYFDSFRVKPFLNHLSNLVRQILPFNLLDF